MLFRLQPPSLHVFLKYIVLVLAASRPHLLTSKLISASSRLLWLPPFCQLGNHFFSSPVSPFGQMLSQVEFPMHLTPNDLLAPVQLDPTVQALPT